MTSRRDRRFEGQQARVNGSKNIAIIQESLAAGKMRPRRSRGRCRGQDERPGVPLEWRALYAEPQLSYRDNPERVVQFRATEVIHRTFVVGSFGSGFTGFRFPARGEVASSASAVSRHNAGARRAAASPIQIPMTISASPVASARDMQAPGLARLPSSVRRCPDLRDLRRR